MPNEDQERVLLHKILVAVDTSAHSQAALEAAAALANLLEADIKGLFVRENHWTRLSGLPSLTAVHELTGEAYELPEDTLEQEIENLTRRLRRQIQRVSRQREIEHSLKTVHGKAEEEILKAARESDLITIGWRGRSYPTVKKLGSTARNIIRKANKPVFVLGKNVRLGKRISVLYNASKEAQRALKLGLVVAERSESELSVILSPEDRETDYKRSKEVEKEVDRVDVPVRITQLPRPDLYSLLYLLNRRRPGLMIMPKNHTFLQGESLDTMLARLSSPLLLMS